MDITVFLLTLIVLLSALIEIWAKAQARDRLVYVFKPLTTLLILALALVSAPSPTPFYKWAVALGLLLSTAGDIFLMLPGDRFLPGLGSFLLAHLAYIAAFTVGRNAFPRLLPLLPWVLYGLLIFNLLRPHFGRMLLPATIYLVVILVMAWSALSAWAARPSADALLALAGAVLFVVSDSALAWRRFRHRFKGADVVVMATYYAAQWLIALSVGAK
ncbi:MAG: lysoplasmalogenase [Anaerolineales bacterium]